MVNLHAVYVCTLYPLPRGVPFLLLLFTVPVFLLVTRRPDRFQTVHELEPFGLSYPFIHRARAIKVDETQRVRVEAVSEMSDLQLAVDETGRVKPTVQLFDVRPACQSEGLLFQAYSQYWPIMDHWSLTGQPTCSRIEMRSSSVVPGMTARQRP